MRTGERIKSLRSSRGMTLEQLSREVGVTRQTLSRYETGVIANIPMDKIETLAKVFDVSPIYLMGLEPPAAPAPAPAPAPPPAPPSPYGDLSNSEKLLLSLYRSLTREEREAMFRGMVAQKGDESKLGLFLQQILTMID